jgi:hypothetical protein
MSLDSFTAPPDRADLVCNWLLFVREYVAPFCIHFGLLHTLRPFFLQVIPERTSDCSYFLEGMVIFWRRFHFCNHALVKIGNQSYVR